MLFFDGFTFSGRSFFLCRNILTGAASLLPCNSLKIMRYGSETDSSCRTVLVLLSTERSREFAKPRSTNVPKARDGCNSAGRNVLWSYSCLFLTLLNASYSRIERRSQFYTHNRPNIYVLQTAYLHYRYSAVQSWSLFHFVFYSHIPDTGKCFTWTL